MNHLFGHRFRNSRASVEFKLDKQCQQGRRQSPIVSLQTVDCLPTHGKIVRRTTRKELEEIGITATAFGVKRDFIPNRISPANETGAFEEQKTPDAGSDRLLESPSPSSDDTINVESNVPSIDASTEVYAGTEHPRPRPRNQQPLLSSAIPGASMAPTVFLPVASRKASIHPEVSSLALPTSQEPFASCERCGKSSVA